MCGSAMALSRVHKYKSINKRLSSLANKNDPNTKANEVFISGSGWMAEGGEGAREKSKKNIIISNENEIARFDLSFAFDSIRFDYS